MIPIFKWISWTNIFKYAGEILAANEFNNLKLSCGTNGEWYNIFQGYNNYLFKKLQYFADSKYAVDFAEIHLKRHEFEYVRIVHYAVNAVNNLTLKMHVTVLPHSSFQWRHENSYFVFQVRFVLERETTTWSCSTPIRWRTWRGTSGRWLVLHRPHVSSVSSSLKSEAFPI